MLPYAFRKKAPTQQVQLKHEGRTMGGSFVETLFSNEDRVLFFDGVIMPVFSAAILKPDRPRDK
jgi:hypothetical protein